jgi:hypothetical protein
MINPIALFRLRQIPASYCGAPSRCAFAQTVDRTKTFHERGNRAPDRQISIFLNLSPARGEQVLDLDLALGPRAQVTEEIFSQSSVTRPPRRSSSLRRKFAPCSRSAAARFAAMLLIWKPRLLGSLDAADLRVAARISKPEPKPTPPERGRGSERLLCDVGVPV